MIFACAALFVIVALVIIIGVIPPAKADPKPGVNHELVATVFWVINSFNLLSAFLLCLIAIRLEERIRKLKPIFRFIPYFCAKVAHFYSITQR
jgi:presenilin-like A22 family membrane protease